jgi:predicted Zn-dependent protease
LIETVHPKDDTANLDVLLYLCLLGLTLVLMHLLFFQKAYMVKAVADKVPVESEKEIGDSQFEHLIESETITIIEDKIVTDRFNELIEPLVNSAKSEYFNYHIYIVDNEQVNAFALPGGYVLINSGLIANADTPEEILGVLGHELAHINQRHIVQKIVNTIGMYSVLAFVFGSIDGLIYAIISGGTTLLEASFSQSAEAEADRLSFAYLTEANINPKGMIDFFKKLKDQSSENKLFVMLSSHPSTDERIANLKSMYDEYKTKNFSSNRFDLSCFKYLLAEQTEHEEEDVLYSSCN